MKLLFIHDLEDFNNVIMLIASDILLAHVLKVLWDYAAK